MKLLFSQLTYEMEKRHQKRLLPSQRPKKRYVAFQVIADTMISLNKVRKSIEMAFEQKIGSDAMSITNFYFLNQRFQNNKGLVRVAPKYQKDMIEAINSIQTQDMSLKTIGVSGTIKKAFEKYIAS